MDRAPRDETTVGYCFATPTTPSPTQVRDFYARPWAAGDAETVVRKFNCECGDPGCDRNTPAQVGSLSAGPVLAQGHRMR